MASDIPRKLWEHPNPKSTEIWRFKESLEKEKGLSLPGYYDLYTYSVRNRAAFWDFAWRYFPIIYEGSYTSAVDESARIDSIPSWFEGIRLNFAENMLFTAEKNLDGSHLISTAGKEDSKVVATQVREGGDAEPIIQITWSELRQRTGRLLQALKSGGLKKGDRVAIVAGNTIDTLVVFLATTALGGLFSSASTDTGVKGILDRLVQIKPKVVFFDDGSIYNHKYSDLRPKIKEVVTGLKDVPEFERLITIKRLAQPLDVNDIPKAETLERFLATASSDKLEFVRVAFRDPFLVAFSSGTTGKPKPIVHGVGGNILNSNKESRLNRSHGPNSTTLQFTTTGWIMYMSAISGLLYGGSTVLYDGSPFIPQTVLIDLLGKYKVTHFGTSPRYMHELRKNKISPREIADLSSLKIVTSTGMVLPESLFEWFYDTGFPAHTLLANISGGTDLAACFGLENPITPLYVGGCQGPPLGIPVEVYDQADEGVKGIKGNPVPDGVPGELVATAAFPTMPVMFLGEDGNKKYFESYFERFDNVWTHGDFIQVHPITKQIFFLGRSDGVLNPSGIRFGSAEIYNIIETQFAQEIVDSLCVGQRRPQDSDESVMLFLLMKPGFALTEELVDRVKAAISKGLSKRHVPAYVFETPEIPTTVNLKKVELPVKQIVSGKKIKASGTLLNPESLEYYYQFVDVEKLVKSKPGRRDSKL
ncbi:hypothetical protein BDV18DRAFT_145881 [Aspergillus unguis]